MRNYLIKCLSIIVVLILLLVGGDIYVYSKYSSTSARMYRVEAHRIKEEISSGNKNPDISKYDSLIAVSEYDPDVVCNNDYLIEEVDGTLYRIEYKAQSSLNRIIVAYTVIIVATILISAAMMLYIGRNIIKPFHTFTELPYELSKGNLTVPLQENKNKFFGRFLWGMDILRGNLEDSKAEELRLLKDKKTLVLSLSHDIKTPLSSIKLYSKALTDDLYKDENKKHEVYKGISENATEIENYVSQIIQASNEDFLHLTVNNSDFYLAETLKKVENYYKDKLSVKHIAFTIGEYDNPLIHGDSDRVIEVIQNIIENAIKYGDGTSISISMSEEEDCRLIRIENTGEPIKEEEIIHLFDSFYRGSNVGNKPGSGLGLYICRKLMHMMDGDIFAENTDTGCAFTIVLRKA